MDAGRASQSNRCPGRFAKMWVSGGSRRLSVGGARLSSLATRTRIDWMHFSAGPRRRL